MNISLVFAGCVFLFNPCVNVYDVLPDFIGLILILRGLYHCAGLNSGVAQARAKFMSALWVSVAKFVVMAIAAVTRNTVFDGTMLLTFSFAFAVLECVFLIPAFAAMTDGLAHLYLMSGENKPPVDETGARVMSVIFVAGHGVLTFAPELTHLYIKDSGYVTSRGEINIDSLHMMLLVICLAGNFLLGAAFLAVIGKFIKTMSRDAEFAGYIADRYENEIGRDGNAALTRSVRLYMLLTGIGLLPFLTVKADLTNIGISVAKFCIGPEFVCGIMFLVALKYVSVAYDKRKMKTRVGVFIGLSASAYVSSFVYSTVLGNVYMPWTEDGFFVYYLPWAVSSAISYLLFALCAGSNRNVCHALIDASVGVRGECTDEHRRELDTQRRSELKRAIDRSTAIMYVYSAISSVCTAILPFVEAAWAIRLLVGLAMFISYYLVGRDLTDEAQNAL